MPKYILMSACSLCYPHIVPFRLIIVLSNVFWERMSSFSCAFTFETAIFLLAPHATPSCPALIIVN